MLSAAPAAGQTSATLASSSATTYSREADLVRGWYRDYLGRGVGPELTAWVQLLRGGMSHIDVQATILGSDEFYQQKKRDPETFILDTLEGVTWQAPSAATIRLWTDRLNQLRGDRVALAREILLAQNEQQQTPASSVTALDQATRLTAASKLLVDNAEFELSGTVQGRQVSLRARALSDASQQLEQQMRVRNIQAAQLNTQFAAVVRSFEAVQQALANPPGTAPSTAGVARRVAALIVEMQVSLRSPTTTPPVTTPNYQTYNQQQLLAQAESVGRAVQSVIQVLTPSANQDYRFQIALRDLEGLSSRVDAFTDAGRRSASREQLDYDLQTLRAQAERIRPQLFEGEPPLFTRLYWLSVEAGLEQLRETLKSTTSSGVGGTSPVVTTKPNSGLISLADQATAQIDAFMAGISPLVYGVPDIPRLQRDVRTLRNHLLEFRQMVVEGEPSSELAQTIRHTANDYQSANTRWEQIIVNYRLQNPVQFAPVGASLDRIYQTLTNVTASTSQRVDPQPQYSQVQRLLGAFDQELTSFQGTLAPFQNYPEYSGLKVFMNQMAGYSQSIVDLDQDPVRNREQQRRYAAGMQRLVDMVDAHSRNIEERAVAANMAEPQRFARQLRQQAQRIAGLVNDLESQLH